MAKQYGLVTSGKKSTLLLNRPSVFGSDSDSDGTSSANVPTAAQQNVIRRQDILAQQKALEEDPTVYQYDEVYSKIENKRNESKLSRKDIDRKPKYINKLLQTAARRKREHELRIERQVQKERDAEGDEFKDKEEYVTAAYKKKLEELRELQEEEKREEYLESIGDVTKQSDLGGFYRHLYEQQVKKEPKSDTEANHSKKDKDSSKSSSDSEKDTNFKDKNRSKRKYRKRRNSEDSQVDSDKDLKEKIHLQSNLDADSDFSIESSDSDEKPPKKVDDVHNTTQEVKSEKEEPSENIMTEKKKDDVLEFEPESVVKPNDKKKPKVDIWKKRTVGAVFDAALQRYYERKNARLNSG